MLYCINSLRWILRIYKVDFNNIIIWSSLSFQSLYLLKQDKLKFLHEAPEFKVILLVLHCIHSLA